MEQVAAIQSFQPSHLLAVVALALRLLTGFQVGLEAVLVLLAQVIQAALETRHQHHHHKAIMVETTVAFVVDQEVEVHLPLVVLQQVVYQVQVVVTGPLLLLAVHL